MSRRDSLISPIGSSHRSHHGLTRVKPPSADDFEHSLENPNDPLPLLPDFPEDARPSDRLVRLPRVLEQEPQLRPKPSGIPNVSLFVSAVKGARPTLK